MLANAKLLERVFKPRSGPFSRELAEHLLHLGFSASDQTRYERLSAKAQRGSLTPAQLAELDDYLNLNDFLIILKAKARASLRRRSSAS
jgi:hypothetical protein